jgi:hypothetical protein
MNSAFQSDGLGFRGVIEEEHHFVGARYGAWPGHPPDMAAMVDSMEYVDPKQRLDSPA